MQNLAVAEQVQEQQQREIGDTKKELARAKREEQTLKQNLDAEKQARRMDQKEKKEVDMELASLKQQEKQREADAQSQAAHYQRYVTVPRALPRSLQSSRFSTPSYHH